MRSTMLAVAVAIALSAASSGVFAQDAESTPPTVKKVTHRARKPASAPVRGDGQSVSSAHAEIEALKAQLAQLQAQVAALQERTDAQSDINVSTGQAVESVQKVQATESKSVAAIDKLVNNTKIGGTAFFDFTDISHKERIGNSGNVKRDGHGAVNGANFDMKRFYLIVDHQFNDIWSANLTTDFNYVANNGQTSLFVKKAYVQGKFDPLFTMRAGAADMPWIPYVDKWYGYRFVENTLIDRTIDGGRGASNSPANGIGSFGVSSDWGVHAMGATSGDNAINYQVSAVNGRGFRNPSRSGNVDVEARFGYQPIEQLVLAIGGYSGKRGNHTKGTGPNGATLPTRTATRGNALVAWREKNFGIGAEYFTAKNWDDVLKYVLPTPVAAVKDKADGYSVYGDWTFAPQWAVFARYDHIDYKYSNLLNAQSKLKDTYYNAGVAYDVLKNLRLALAWKYDKLKGPANTFEYKTNEIGMWGMLTY